jgi:exonuclease SbcD
MRIFHTADWHLGQTLHGFDREHEHNAFLAHLLTLIKEHRPDALLVSGDVFDTINPSANAQRTLFNFIHTAHETLPSLQIILTAGNHDAAGRLEAPADLLRFVNTRVVGIIDRNENGSIQLEKLVIPLTGPSGTVQALILAIPFLRIADVPNLPSATDPYLEGIAALYHSATQEALRLKSTKHPNARIIAMGHGTVQAGVRSADSERPIVIGTSEELPLSTFPAEIDYVALGHLHRPQACPANRIVYSGSPIPLSFSETTYRHRICQIDILPNHPPSLTEHLIPRSIELLRIPNKPAPIEDVISALQQLPHTNSTPDHTHPFLEVRILADQPDPARRKKIEDALANKAARLASIRVENPAQNPSTLDPFLPLKSLDAIERMDPLELMTAAHLEQTKTPPSPRLVAALNEVVSTLPNLPA